MYMKMSEIDFYEFNFHAFKKLVAAPILEELTFRTLVAININKNFENNGYYILVSSVLFSLAHFHIFRKFSKSGNRKMAVIRTRRGVWCKF